ncbi:hypothetical protein Q7C_2292 [Methylophaga frappieri]|uniref:Uncharacterized protein n=1 Tax=Methylophaga frappieri (strain ATCC BAA-2434 / DSM 25690 / JAM7) TaxID=754477 RepID=I1YKI3_METFJ|nr:hypothetical protein Q7C_2292 [Methylophaga frappieri]
MTEFDGLLTQLFDHMLNATGTEWQGTFINMKYVQGSV